MPLPKLYAMALQCPKIFLYVLLTLNRGKDLYTIRPKIILYVVPLGAALYAPEKFFIRSVYPRIIRIVLIRIK